MKQPPVKETHYGREVWTNKQMDELRKVECLCLNCAAIDNCNTAKEMYVLCRSCDLALAVTRCPHWEGIR